MRITKLITAVALAMLALAGAARADITTGLLLSLQLDNTNDVNNAALTDDSGMGSVQYLTNDPTPIWADGIVYHPGYTNTSLYFNTNTAQSTSNCIAIPWQPSIYDFNITTQFTVAMWIYPENAASGNYNVGGCLFDEGPRGSQDITMEFYNSGQFRVYAVNKAGATLPTSTGIVSKAPYAAFANRTWYHIAMVWNGIDPANTYIALYINGAVNGSVTNTTCTSIRTNGYPMRFGTRNSLNPPNDDSLDQPFKGRMDDIRIYNRALSASDIYQLYSTSFGPPVFATQPQSISRYVNDPALFSPSVSSADPKTAYQWCFNTAVIVGATNSTLTLAHVGLTNAGDYTLVVTNNGGAITSSVAHLTVSALPSPDTASGLIAYYRLDEGAGTTINDATANAENGLLYNTAGDAAVWDSGVFGGALRFPATGTNFVAIPDVATSDANYFDFSTGGRFTIAAWVNGTNVQNSAVGIIAKGNGRGGEHFCIDLGSGRYRAFTRDATGASSYNVQTSVAPDNNWQHIAAVYEGTNNVWYFYVNGQLAAFAVAAPNLLASDHEVSLGARQSAGALYDYPWRGLIDDVRFYNRPLTAADIAALYGAAVTAPVSISTVTRAGGATQLAGSGPTNLEYRIWASTNLALPFAQWTVLATSGFDASGQFTFSDTTSTNLPTRFYRVSVP